MNPQELTPTRIVAELDRYIVGQSEAKRAVAVALRNRYRRERLSGDMRDEVIPKNILMIGPTGVGKTEIARRLSTLVGAPFVKVEATKYTEVGYVGRDVESMVRDLVEASIRMLREERLEETRGAAADAAIERLADIIDPSTRTAASNNAPFSALSAMLGGHGGSRMAAESATQTARSDDADERRRKLKEELRAGFYDVRIVEIDVEETPQVIGAFGGPQFEEMGGNIGEMLGNILPKQRKKRRVTVAEARDIFTQEEAAKLVDNDGLKREAVRRAESNGIIFIDEMDKIAGGGNRMGPDVSREGVQRDILPIVEGSTVVTKYGPVRTDHVLFIGAGAFHISKPSDLIPELQGRFPIRVELDSLSKDDFKTILTQPKNALIEQYRQLLAADGVTLSFTDDGIDAIAGLATLVNEQTENIGARRLHTMLERVLETVSFAAPEAAGSVVIDKRYVEDRLADIVKDQDLSHYIL
ncbi:MAG TPA: ATP-dependent protease ATPase subunit HslU [Candidatus Eremiobacteraceae bacterium]|nr:ATP-dependent protease ATPase subunit HslU [Candidatus Eremiobacteraceae bacterium]